MASLAAFVALQQLIFKPHYWEKTQHGLHLNSSSSSKRVISVTEEPNAEQVTMPLPAYESRENLLSPSLATQFEPASPRLSSQISLIAEQFELELIEKSVKLKARASRDLTPAQPQSEEFEFEDDTLKLPVLQIVRNAPLSGEFELEDETLELAVVQAEKNTSMEHVLLLSAVPTRALPSISLPKVERR
jgi:hypothetical protein